ncbi:MAG: hypothetical protein RLZZ298_484 [Pseudomonadota bacterium]|jgi:cobalamin synthase
MAVNYCAMTDEEKWAFWKVGSASSERKKSIWFVSCWGIALIIAPIFFGLTGLLIAAVAGIVIFSLSVSSSCCMDSDEKPKPPEPNLELIDEKYRLKATGIEGITALTFIAALSEQEDRKNQRLVLVIGFIFGLVAVGLALQPNSILPSGVAAALSVFCLAWSMKIKKLRIKGFGIDLSSSS